MSWGSHEARSMAASPTVEGRPAAFKTPSRVPNAPLARASLLVFSLRDQASMASATGPGLFWCLSLPAHILLGSGGGEAEATMGKCRKGARAQPPKLNTPVLIDYVANDIAAGVHLRQKCEIRGVESDRNCERFDTVLPTWRLQVQYEDIVICPS
jgi:hypothetical protein